MTQSLTLGDRKSHAFLMASLDTKQKLYVESRVLGSVPVVAARVAGYRNPDKKVVELENEPQIRMAVELSVRLKARETEITRDDVVGWMMDALRNSVTATEQLNAAKEIGKLLGHYEPTRVDINKTVTLKQEQLRSMDDADLLRIAKDTIDGNYEILDFEPEPRLEPAMQHGLADA